MQRRSPSRRIVCGLVTLWNIGAARLFRKGVAAESVGPGSGASTNLLEFAGAAFAFQLRSIAQVAEERRLAIDTFEALLAYSSRGEGQKAAGENFAFMRDEDEAFAVVEASWSAADLVG